MEEGIERLREVGTLERVHYIRLKNPPRDHVQFQVLLILKEVNSEFNLSQCETLNFPLILHCSQ